MMYTAILSVAVFAVVCQAQLLNIHFGACPKVTVVDHLDVSKYMGDWYEIKKFRSLIEAGESCIKFNYTLKSDGHIQVIRQGRKADGSIHTAKGDAVTMVPSEPAMLAVTYKEIGIHIDLELSEFDVHVHGAIFTFSCVKQSTSMLSNWDFGSIICDDILIKGDHPYRVRHWILDTDYSSYSLVWSCVTIGLLEQAQNAWIMSRTRTLDQATVDKATQKLASFGVDTSSFVTTLQDQSCVF